MASTAILRCHIPQVRWNNDLLLCDSITGNLGALGSRLFNVSCPKKVQVKYLEQNTLQEVFQNGCWVGWKLM